MLQFVAELLVKSTILLLIPIGLSLVKSHTSADMRSKINLVVLMTVALLPFVIALGPDVVVWQTTPGFGLADSSFSASISAAGNASGTTVATAADSNDMTDSNTLANFTSAAYFSVTFLMVLLLVLRNRKTNRSMRELVEVQNGRVQREFEELRLELCPERQIRLCWQESSASTLTWGVFKSTIGIPAGFVDWPLKKRKAAFLHEIAHILRNDCASVLFARFVVAVYWWHPLSWMAMTRLKHDIECATDDRVLAYGIRANDYAQYLVDVASRNSPTIGFGIAMANRSGTLRGRISALIATGQRRKTMAKTTQLITLLVGFLTVFLIGSLNVAAAPPSGIDREYIRLYSASPEYPKDAMEEGVEGYVDLKFDINLTGTTENIEVLHQVPESGVFEQAAIDAMRTFRYLPKIQGGKPAVEQGARIRLQFSLNAENARQVVEAGDTKSDDITSMSNAITKTNRDFRARLKQAALDADRDQDGERFLDLAANSHLAQPEMASYFLLRATQLGTRRTAKLALLKAMTLYKLGDLERSLELFTQIAENEGESKSTSNWIAHIEYQIRRRELVYDELMSQRQ